MPKEAVPTQTSWDELSQRNFSPMPDGVTRREQQREATSSVLLPASEEEGGGSAGC
mgnify:CR=1 FL=1